MRIAIDARELCGRPTGVGRYLSHVLSAWETLPSASGHEFVLIGPDAPLELETQALVTRGNLRLSVRRVPGGAGTAWEQWHLRQALRAERPDVLFCPAYTAPLLTGIPLVLTVHDVSFAAHPEWYPPRTRLRRRVLTALAAREARLVLTDAEFGRQEIVSLLGVRAERVRVVPLALTAPAAGSYPSAARADSRASREPVILYVGSIFNRRHLPELAAAVSRIAQKHPEVRLEVVGDDRTYPRQDLAGLTAASGGRITLRAYVSDAELASLYQSAGVFAFLSDYEGFGLTPLEAMASGLPVVVGDTPVAREVYGDAARYVPTTDVDAIAAGLESQLFDPREREAVLGAVAGVLGRYSWERTAAATLAALEEAGGA